MRKQSHGGWIGYGNWCVMPKYPNVICSDPAIPPAPRYVVCKHVHGPADVGYFKWATAKELGEIACHGCVAADWVNPNEVVLMCAHCCRAKGLLPDRVH